jgi:hypothetical protein
MRMLPDDSENIEMQTDLRPDSSTQNLASQSHNENISTATDTTQTCDNLPIKKSNSLLYAQSEL